MYEENIDPGAKWFKSEKIGGNDTDTTNMAAEGPKKGSKYMEASKENGRK